MVRPQRYSGTHCSLAYKARHGANNHPYTRFRAKDGAALGIDYKSNQDKRRDGAIDYLVMPNCHRHEQSYIREREREREATSLMRCYPGPATTLKSPPVAAAQIGWSWRRSSDNSTSNASSTSGWLVLWLGSSALSPDPSLPLPPAAPLQSLRQRGNRAVTMTRRNKVWVVSWLCSATATEERSHCRSAHTRCAV